MTSPSRPILHASGRQFDLAEEQPAELVQFLAGLHENLPAREHALKCLSAGGDQDVYVWKLDGHYWVRHFQGGRHDGGHRVIPESDEHRRGKDYTLRALEDAGIPAATEIRSDNRTRSDVAAFGSVVIAAEIQTSYVKSAAVKARDTRARRATAIVTPEFARPLPHGIQPIWAQLHDDPADWLYRVPSVRATVQHSVWGEHLPAPRTVGAVGVRRIEREPCRPGSRWPQCPLTGRHWCWGWHPIASLPDDEKDHHLLDDVYLMGARGLLKPLRYHQRNAVYLVPSEDVPLYEELGGNGDYAVTNDRPAGRRLRPCGWRGHLPPEPEPAPEPERTAYEALARSERRAAQERADAERARQHADRMWAIATYDRRIRQQIRDKQEAESRCGYPRCKAQGRPYMNGTWCDRHARKMEHPGAQSLSAHQGDRTA